MKNTTAARIAVAASVSKRNSVNTRPQQFIITFYDRATQAYNVIRVSNAPHFHRGAQQWLRTTLELVTTH